MALILESIVPNAVSHTMDVKWRDAATNMPHRRIYDYTQKDQFIADVGEASADYLAEYDAMIEWGNANPPPPPTAEELAAQEQAAKDAADVLAARAHTKLKALRQMSPAQVSSWVDANVTNLASAQDAIKTLAIAVSVLSRRL